MLQCSLHTPRPHIPRFLTRYITTNLAVNIKVHEEGEEELKKSGKIVWYKEGIDAL